MITAGLQSAVTSVPGTDDGTYPPDEITRLKERVALLEHHLRKRDEQRRALLHILGDLQDMNRRLSSQRKAMLHILVDYEEDRRRLGRQAGAVGQLAPRASAYPAGCSSLQPAP